MLGTAARVNIEADDLGLYAGSVLVPDDLSGARQMNEESLALFRQMGDRWAVGQLLNNQACVASDQGQYAEARSLLQESLSIRRQLGDKAGLALSLNTLADVVLDEGDFGSARPLLDESLALNRDLGVSILYISHDLASVDRLCHRIIELGSPTHDLICA